MQRSSEHHPSPHKFSNEHDEEDMDDEGEEAAEAEGRGETGSTTTAAMTTTTTGGNTKTFVTTRFGSILEVSWGHRGALSGGVLEARTL